MKLEPIGLSWVISDALAPALGCFLELVPSCCPDPHDMRWLLAVRVGVAAFRPDRGAVPLCASVSPCSATPLCKAPREALSHSSRFANKV